MPAPAQPRTAAPAPRAAAPANAAPAPRPAPPTPPIITLSPPVQVSCTPWRGLAPSSEFMGALYQAQQAMDPMVKDAAREQKKKYSKTEDWLIEAKKVLHAAGLMASQVGGTLEDRAKGLIDRVQFLVVFPKDGTGLLYTYDWPIFGFDGGSQGDACATALTRTWKLFLRGLLMVAQVDEGEEGEYEERRWAPPQRQQRPAPPRQAPPRQAPPRQQARQQEELPPIEEEPAVVRSQEILGPDINDGDANNYVAPNPNPPERELPADGGPDHTFEDLCALGWNEEFAAALAGVPTNEPISPELRNEFLSAVSEFFQGNSENAMAKWEGTGFTPAGEKGPKPTGAQLRRFCVKLDWNKRATSMGR